MVLAVATTYALEGELEKNKSIDIKLITSGTKKITLDS